MSKPNNKVKQNKKGNNKLQKSRGRPLSRNKGVCIAAFRKASRRQLSRWKAAYTSNKETLQYGYLVQYLQKTSEARNVGKSQRKVIGPSFTPGQWEVRYTTLAMGSWSKLNGLEARLPPSYASCRVVDVRLRVSGANGNIPHSSTIGWFEIQKALPNALYRPESAYSIYGMRLKWKQGKPHRLGLLTTRVHRLYRTEEQETEDRKYTSLSSGEYILNATTGLGRKFKVTNHGKPVELIVRLILEKPRSPPAALVSLTGSHPSRHLNRIFFEKETGLWTIKPLRDVFRFISAYPLKFEWKFGEEHNVRQDRNEEKEKAESPELEPEDFYGDLRTISSEEDGKEKKQKKKPKDLLVSIHKANLESYKSYKEPKPRIDVSSYEMVLRGQPHFVCRAKLVNARSVTFKWSLNTALAAVRNKKSAQQAQQMGVQLDKSKLLDVKKTLKHHELWKVAGVEF